MSRRVWLSLLAFAGLLGLLFIPVTTRQGVNFQVREIRLPLIVKGAEFLIRDYEYRALAGELTSGLKSEETKADALLRWTHAQLRPTPPGWRVVDDHISHILIRGYGEPDQRADVFTTLCAYSGLPAFWRGARDGPRPGHWIVSFVKINGRWTVWDVEKGGVFRDAQGVLQSAEELGWKEVRPPATLRPEKQMPLRRLGYELWKAGRRLAGRSVPDDE